MIFFFEKIRQTTARPTNHTTAGRITYTTAKQSNHTAVYVVALVIGIILFLLLK